MIFRDPLQHTPLTPWKCGKWTRMLSVPIPRRSQAATTTTTKLVERKLFYAKYSKLKTMSTIPIWFVLLCHLHCNDHVYSVAHLLRLSLCSLIVFRSDQLHPTPGSVPAIMTPSGPLHKSASMGTIYFPYNATSPLQGLTDCSILLIFLGKLSFHHPLQ